MGALARNRRLVDSHRTETRTDNDEAPAGLFFTLIKHPALDNEKSV
jgi:hypothetical protein